MPLALIILCCEEQDCLAARSFVNAHYSLTMFFGYFRLRGTIPSYTYRLADKLSFYFGKLHHDICAADGCLARVQPAIVSSSLPTNCGDMSLSCLAHKVWISSGQLLLLLLTLLTPGTAPPASFSEWRCPNSPWCSAREEIFSSLLLE